MSTMTLNASTINTGDILDYTQQLINEVVEAGQQGQAAHVVESSLFKHMLKMDLQLLGNWKFIIVQ